MNKFFKNTSIFIVLDSIFFVGVLYYFYKIFFENTVNMPINDDYDLINNLCDIVNTNSIGEKFSLFYNQHNEHRILYDKLWFYVSYYFNDSGLDFNFLSFIGTLSLLFLVLFFYKYLKHHFKDYLLLFPLSVLLINFAFWENITFSMAGLSNFTFYLFLVLSLYYITKPGISRKNTALSLLFYALSFLTQGGGIFLLPILICIAFFKKNRNYFIQYFLGCITLTVIYFIGYEKHPSPPILEIVSNFLFHIQFALAFLGSCIANYHFFPDNIEYSVNSSFVLGCLLFLFYVFLIYKKYYKKNTFNFALMTFILIISGITSITRLYMGVETAVSSRYRISSSIFIICMFIYFLENVKDKQYSVKKVNILILLMSCVYLFQYNFNTTNRYLFEFRKKNSLFGALCYYSNDNSFLNSLNKDLSIKILNKAKKSEVYFLNEDLINNYYKFAKESKTVLVSDNSNATTNHKVEVVKKLKDSYYIEGFAFMNEMNSKNQKVHLILYNSGKQIVFDTKQISKPGYSTYFKTKNLDDSGFLSRIKLEDIQNGENTIYLLLENNDIKKIIKTNTKILK